MTSPDPGARRRAWAERVERSLDTMLPRDTEAPLRLHAAMRYATLGGGKRIRPLLVYATGTALGAREDALDHAAAAVELIHGYSLVHDDLPAMDDDALRRGRATVHVAYDEATAILAGDALQALAFETLTNAPLPGGVCVAMLRELAAASGARAGMCGGQALDIDAIGSTLDLHALQRMHAAKTGALIRACVRLGAMAANAGDAERAALDDYAEALGLAFQIRDDLLDVEGEASVIGKTAGKDAAHGKPTYPGLLGVEAARELLVPLAARMRAALAQLPPRHEELAHLAQFAVQRAS